MIGTLSFRGPMFCIGSFYVFNQIPIKMLIILLVTIKKTFIFAPALRN